MPDDKFMAREGEHWLSAEEVNRMGGQEAVYRFRASLRAQWNAADEDTPPMP